MGKAAGAVLMILGILMLIGSIGMYFAATATVNDYETTAGQFTRALSEDAQNEYETAVGMQACAGIGAVIGIILSIVGAFLIFKTEPQRQQPYYQQPPQQYQQPPPQYQQTPQQPYQYPQQQYQQPTQLPGQQSQQPYQSPQQPQGKYCMSCGKQIPIDSKMCPYCGLQLPGYQ